MLQFNEADHSYTWNGQRVPSVTQILKPIVSYEGISEAVLDIARGRGQDVHLATELDDTLKLDEASISEVIRPYLNAWRQFKRDKGVVVLECERRVFSPLHRYAGTLDRVLGFDDGSEFLVDVKATAVVRASVGPQTAAYAAAYGAPGLRRASIQLRPDGLYRFRELTNPRDWLVFQACHVVHRFNQESTNVQ